MLQHLDGFIHIIRQDTPTASGHLARMPRRRRSHARSFAGRGHQWTPPPWLPPLGWPGPWRQPATTLPTAPRPSSFTRLTLGMFLRRLEWQLHGRKHCGPANNNHWRGHEARSAFTSGDGTTTTGNGTRGRWRPSLCVLRPLTGEGGASLWQRLEQADNESGLPDDDEEKGAVDIRLGGQLVTIRAGGLAAHSGEGVEGGSGHGEAPRIDRQQERRPSRQGKRRRVRLQGAVASPMAPEGAGYSPLGLVLKLDMT